MKVYAIVEINYEYDDNNYCENGISDNSTIAYKDINVAKKVLFDKNKEQYIRWGNDLYQIDEYQIIDCDRLNTIFFQNDIEYFVEDDNKYIIDYKKVIELIESLSESEQIDAYDCFNVQFYKLITIEVDENN